MSQESGRETVEGLEEPFCSFGYSLQHTLYAVFAASAVSAVSAVSLRRKL